MNSANPRAVIFVGGTPYSGAEAVAELLASGPGLAMAPAAVRIHSDARGIPALLGGRIGLGDFVAGVRAGEVAERVGAQALEAPIGAFRDAYDDDPLEACRGLLWALLDAVTEGSPPGKLVDASPGNLLEAHTLARLVPEARFVHVIRDGRDVATAAAEAKAAPPRLAAALEWWSDQLRDVERGIRGEEDGAQYAIPDAQLMTVVVDELASGEGGAAYLGLLDGLRLDGGQPSRSTAEPPLDPAEIELGRWRKYARGPGSWLFSRRYARALTELAEEGSDAAGALRDRYARLG